MTPEQLAGLVAPLEFVYGRAESIVGNYLVDSGWKDKIGGERWWAWLGPDHDKTDPFAAWQYGARAENEAAAKAAAQADYAARILSALNLPALEALVREAERRGREAGIREAADVIERHRDYGMLGPDGDFIGNEAEVIAHGHSMHYAMLDILALITKEASE